MYLTALANVHKALLLHCGQELRDGFPKQFVAVDDVRPTVSDGLYSKCTPHPHPSVFYTMEKKYIYKKKEIKKKERKKILNAPLPICLSSNVSTV